MRRTRADVEPLVQPVEQGGVVDGGPRVAEHRVQERRAGPAGRGRRRSSAARRALRSQPVADGGLHARRVGVGAAAPSTSSIAPSRSTRRATSAPSSQSISSAVGEQVGGHRPRGRLVDRRGRPHAGIGAAGLPVGHRDREPRRSAATATTPRAARRCRPSSGRRPSRRPGRARCGRDRPEPTTVPTARSSDIAVRGRAAAAEPARLLPPAARDVSRTTAVTQLAITRGQVVAAAGQRIVGQQRDHLARAFGADEIRPVEHGPRQPRVRARPRPSAGLER